MTFSATIDPVPSSAHRASPDAVVRVDLLFHSDLRRVGGQSVLGAAADGRAHGIGRDAPLFTTPAGGEPLPLLDPCISRHQLSVTYDAGRGVFEVSQGSGARRPLGFFDPQGAEVRPTELRPGALVAVGDRALLRLSVGAIPEPPPGPELTGLGEQADSLRARVRALAACDDTVLISGPTGAGKEQAALALHRWGARASGPFVAVNCAAIPEQLIESELFGHVKGAFSGAIVARRGLFEEARGGTLFLDEIGDLSLPAQAKVLRVLQDHRLRAVGAVSEVPVDVRVVAATHRDLLREVEAGRFREDLFGRLEGFSVAVPPLSARREDIPVFFSRFFASRVASGKDPARWLRAASELAPPLPMSFFLRQLARDWPRNVRELERFAAATALSCEQAVVFASPQPGARPAEVAQGRVGEDELRRLLEAHEHVSQRVARALGVSTTTLDRWLREHGIVRPCDLTEARVRAALDDAGGDAVQAARALAVSTRGLKLRLRELGLAPGASR